MKYSREIKIGITFIVAVGLFIWGFNFLKGKNVLKHERTFYAVYQTINGLVTSSPVMVNGMKVGLVKEIRFHPDGSNNVIVGIGITNSSLLIPDNSRIIIYSADLMGTKAINLKLGDSKIFARPGDTLHCELQATLSEEVNRQVLPLKNKAESLMSSIDSAITIIRYVFNEKTRENLEKSFTSIKNTIQNIEKTSYNIDSLVSTQKKRMTIILANIESISTNIKNNNQKITEILTHFAAISDTLSRIKISKTISLVNESLNQTSEIMAKIDKGEGSLGLLINDKKLYNELESSSHELKLLLEDMRLHPDRYVHFSLFGSKPKSGK